jgi:hypothetical protein
MFPAGLAAARPLLALLGVVTLAAAPAAAQFGFGSNYGSSYTSGSAARPSGSMFGSPSGYPAAGTYRPSAGSALPTMPVRPYGAAAPKPTGTSSYGPTFASGGGYTRRQSNVLPFAMGAFAGGRARARASSCPSRWLQRGGGGLG